MRNYLANVQPVDDFLRALIMETMLGLEKGPYRSRGKRELRLTRNLFKITYNLGLDRSRFWYHLILREVEVTSGHEY